MKVEAKTMDFQELNLQIKTSKDKEIIIENCLGQRYIGSGLTDIKLKIYGTPGNALGCYLNGSEIHVYGNTQEATGDTMNEGSIYIHGSSGDATGYAMRGGKIFVKENAGYRAGIHMKAYKEKIPVLIIGGKAGDFLGEYQAGGIIIVLGLGCEGIPVGDFCGTGMHGGKIYLRTTHLPEDLPPQVVVKQANKEDKAVIIEYIEAFCYLFSIDINQIMQENFYVLYPNTNNPYKQLYTHH